ncbi:hypothetical protein ENUP19_0304G0015 [Entamoeba nuttalli]|uniref:Ran binding protein, putative n=2 Tax=Entamoeba nuttalli TaxID=412467 RepID=K2H4S0_ENTNP|nr:Ran binding protein, putative [Entamoeba nuttalli P19]EKE41347.1 Ran binding protein, putative [Entamoeba nuttalli P19]|eukprot:XP_008856320.1 Ran binding protein, putative [Entamoeba nuttalli P19]
MSLINPQQFITFCEELYTTPNNQRRKELIEILPISLEKKEDLSDYLSLLLQTDNVYAQQYIISLILNSFKLSPSTFLSCSNDIQTTLLKVIQKSTTQGFIARSCYNLFSITVVYSWKTPDNSEIFLTTIRALVNSLKPMLINIAVHLIFCVLDGAQSNFSKMNLEKNQISTIKTTVIFELMKLLISLIKSIQLIPNNEDLIKTILNSLNSGIGLCHSWHYDEEYVNWIHLPEKIYVVVQDEEFYQKLIEIYGVFASTTTSSVVMELLFVLASLRQISVPNAMSKQRAVELLSLFIQSVIDKEIGLYTNENFVLTCRFLMKFRTTQLTGSTTTTEWLKSVSRFTIKVFQSNNMVCISNMLSFWMKYTLSMFRYPEKAQKWNIIINEICQVFIQSMIAKEEYYFIHDPSEDPLLSEEQIQLIYETYGPIARYSYESFYRYIKSIFNKTIQEFASLCSTPLTEQGNLKKNIISSQLAFIIEMVVGVLKAKLIMATDTLSITLDTSISNIIFPFVIQYNQYVQRAGYIKDIKEMESSGDFRLQKACINFMTVFRTTLIAKNSVSSLSQMEVERIATTEDFLKFYLEMVSTILSEWRHSVVIITKCLELFTVISSSSLFNYQLFKFEMVRNMVSQNHISLLSNFKGTPKQLKKIHFELYRTLGTILFNCRLSIYLPLFLKQFIPIIEQIQLYIKQPNSNFDTSIIFTLFTDLRSVIITSKECETVPMCLYDFLIVHIFPLITPLISLLQRTPILLIPLLRLLGDIASSKNFQENFPIESPNCMRIFKGITMATASLCASFIQNSNKTYQNPYLECFKPICLCLRAMSECFKCNLVNFAIFQIYQDNSVVETLNVVLDTALRIPFNALEEYPKIVKGVYSFIDSLSLICNSNVLIFTEKELLNILQLVINGMKMKNGDIILNCSHFLNGLLDSIYSSIKRRNFGIDKLVQFCSNSFEPILWISFDNILNDFDIWALSRPIQLIFLLRPNSFDTLMLALTKKIKSPIKQQSFLNYSSTLKNSIDPIYNDVTQERFEESLRQFVQCVKQLFD